MSQVTTLILLPQTPHTVGHTIVGDKVPGAGYYQNLYNLQTFTWSLNSFVGQFNLQATIANDPTDSDWFTIHSFFSGNPGDSLTQNSHISIRGNFTWLRTRIVGFTNGTIQNIKVTY